MQWPALLLRDSSFVAKRVGLADGVSEWRSTFLPVTGLPVAIWGVLSASCYPSPCNSWLQILSRLANPPSSKFSGD